ncbi:hypothetical protein KR009_004571 [Drosophila setifemur]|nr:hypothetical protein KR009_004571 [Drosophila setifemur]
MFNNGAQDAMAALVQYFSSAPGAEGHILSLTVDQFNGTDSSSSLGGNASTSYFATLQPPGEEQEQMLTTGSATSVVFGFGDTGSSGRRPRGAGAGISTAAMPVWLIPSYSIILLFAVVGNLMVISTLLQNRRMRTITNVFLLNLAISDMLLGVLCMPVTLVGTLLRNFIFGEFLCKLFQFSQAASVAVSSWTLVAISCERYYAICHPLRSRSWQTMNHAYKIIVSIWMSSILCMSPIATYSQLLPTSRPGFCKCRETWPDPRYELFYNILLDMLLLVLPLVVLCVAYFLIIRTLYLDIAEDSNRLLQQQQQQHHQYLQQQAAGSGGRPGGGAGAGHCIVVLDEESSNNNKGVTGTSSSAGGATPTTRPTMVTTSSTVTLAKTASPSIRVHDAALRRSNEAKTLESKRRVVKMLFVLVMEFFICWTPLYVINTLTMLYGPMVYEYVDYTAISFLQLLAYSSSCCNPITYCFMNASFRRAFLDTFRVWRPWRRGGPQPGAGAGAMAHSAASQPGYIPNNLYANSNTLVTNANANPGQAMGMGTWRSRSRNELLTSSPAILTSNSNNPGQSVDSPQL